MEEIGRGAEAVIYKDKDRVIKKRVPKTYRIKEIDEPLRKSRTRRETKVMTRLQEKNIPSPRVISTDNKETIEMDFIPGERLADCITKDNYAKLMERVGELTAALHDSGIAHGDLTTSNMIFDNDVYLIDFGLSFFTLKIEDKAVDIHLLKEALEAKHYQVYKKAFEAFKKGYKKCKDFKEVLERLEIVEGRGRYKGKS